MSKWQDPMATQIACFDKDIRRWAALDIPFREIARRLEDSGVKAPRDDRCVLGSGYRIYTAVLRYCSKHLIARPPKPSKPKPPRVLSLEEIRRNQRLAALGASIRHALITPVAARPRGNGRVIDMGGITGRWLHWTAQEQVREFEARGENESWRAVH